MAQMNAVQHVTMCMVLRSFIGAGNRPEFINLVLKKIGIDCADPHSVLLRHLGGIGRINTHGEIPLHMHGNGRAAAGVFVNRPGVGEFLFDGTGRSGLKEFTEAGAGIAIAPGGGFDLEAVEQFEKGFSIHGVMRLS